MKRIENFIYNDIVLYAKCWYEHSENICDDLSFLISKIYYYKPKTESGVSLYMIKVLDELNKLNDKKYFNDHFSFEQEIRNTTRLYDCSRDKAIIYLVLSVLYNLSNKEIKLNKPIYGKKEKFRLGSFFGKNKISMTYKEMNKIADKFFNNN